MVPSDFIHDGVNFGVNTRHGKVKGLQGIVLEAQNLWMGRENRHSPHLPSASGNEDYQCPWRKRKLFKFGAGGAGNTARVEVRAPLLEEILSLLPPCVQGSELRSLGFGSKCRRCPYPLSHLTSPLNVLES